MIKHKRQSDGLAGLDRFWIIGGGRFGRIAVDRILARKHSATITVVDPRTDAYHRDGITTIRQHGIAWLRSRLVPAAPVDVVVPAAPIHVAADWIASALAHRFIIDPVFVPDAWLRRLPHAVRGPRGRVYVSHADFICPDDCPEPERICTHTGKPRPVDLFDLLGRLTLGDMVPVVVRSHQLLPGVGGIYPADLMLALQTAGEAPARLLMIATACRCHGVLDVFRLATRIEDSVPPAASHLHGSS